MKPSAYAARAYGARLSLAIVQFGPITAVPHRMKANTFTRSSILFRPHEHFGGAAGYRPRVRSGYSVRVYHYSFQGNILYMRFISKNFNRNLIFYEVSCLVLQNEYIQNENVGSYLVSRRLSTTAKDLLSLVIAIANLPRHLRGIYKL